MNPDLVPMLLDVSIDPCDGSVHPSLQYVLIRGFTAMGWEQPRSASEDMAMEILKMIRPNLASGGTVAPSVQPLIGERPLCQPSRPDAGGGVREAFVSVLASLAAAISLLERMPKAKKAAPSDTMFAIMLDDYRKALETGRAALSTSPAAAESNASVEARLREESHLDACREKLSALRERERQKMNAASDRAEGAASTGDMAEVSISSTESERHRQAFSALNAAIAEFDKLYEALSLVGDEAKKSEGGCICQDQHRRGYCTEPGCPYAIRPSDPTAERREIVAREPGFIKPDTDRQVFFYEQDFYVLSNFSAFEVEWSGFTFKTSEHLYHWLRFTLSDVSGAQHIAGKVKNARSAHDAFKLAQEHKRFQVPDWDNQKIDFMREVLRQKAGQNEYVRRKLLATGERELIEDSWRDDFWGWGPNRDGQNMLGKLWMEVRTELRLAALDGGAGA